MSHSSTHPGTGFETPGQGARSAVNPPRHLHRLTPTARACRWRVRLIAERADLTGVLDPHPGEQPAMPDPRSSTQQHGPRVYSRRKGTPTPPDAVYVGRPGPFGNAFTIGRDGDRATVIVRYEQWLHAPAQAALRERAVRELRGRDLVCWCAPEACHGDVLLQCVNAPQQVTAR